MVSTKRGQITPESRYNAQHHILHIVLLCLANSWVCRMPLTLSLWRDHLFWKLRKYLHQKKYGQKTKKINTYMLQLKILQTLLACIQVNSTDCFDIILNIHDGLTSARNIINHCTANGVGFRRSNGCKLQMNDNEDNIFLSNVMNNEYTVYM
jgi:hypothetical protein